MYEIFEQLLKERNISAYKIAKETGVTTATLTSWKQGKYTPKQDKLQKIADYFGVSLEYLMTGETNTDETPYYINDDAREIAEELAQNPNLHILFDTARGVSAEDLQFVIDMVKRLKQDSE
ncbi:helix-turn-helix protein [anaerobic digester metagenome]|uniref:helix-turn-helix domain-containing protein n=1 Tax=Anaerotignum propionicum TaxID=28446 RepID=UPI002B1FC465|nr:helix-turn-helix transcriptional regulator [Anaerotignum propionicum]MEA5058365.1 helix-turn-helix transcriptional regulator [Anaerotignum propionicum]